MSLEGTYGRARVQDDSVSPCGRVSAVERREESDGRNATAYIYPSGSRIVIPTAWPVNAVAGRSANGRESVATARRQPREIRARSVGLEPTGRETLGGANEWQEGKNSRTQKRSRNTITRIGMRLTMQRGRGSWDEMKRLQRATIANAVAGLGGTQAGRVAENARPVLRERRMSSRHPGPRADILPTDRHATSGLHVTGSFASTLIWSSRQAAVIMHVSDRCLCWPPPSTAQRWFL